VFRERIDLEDPVDFLNAVGPRALTDGRLRQWLHRGVSDAEHLLVSSALRPYNKELVATLGRIGPSASVDLEHTQRIAEGRILMRFFEQCDRQGLPLPNEAGALRNDMLFGTSTIAADPAVDSVWPNPSLSEVLGLAQHYGMPTRLLDWSRNGMVAAYFAAAGGVNRVRRCDLNELVRVACNEDGVSQRRIAVWSLDFYSSQTGYRRDPRPLQIVVPPYFQNPNLAAQEGAFTMWRTALGSEESTDRRPLDELMLRSDFWTDEEDHPTFRVVTLPVLAAPTLALLLHGYGYSAARLFPGYDGARRAVVEEEGARAAVKAVDEAFTAAQR